MIFGSLFGKSKSPKGSNGKVPQLSPAVSGSILNALGSRSIPPMPGAAQKAFQLATDPSAESRDFIEIIEADEALAARVLKIANSVYYDRGKKSTTIEESVILIGLEELRGLLNANTLCEIFPCRHPARTWLWANDIATGLIARTLSQRILPSKSSEAFLGGLMHDIGKLALLQRATDDYQKILKTVENEGITFAEAEESVFPFDHTEAGQLVGEKWKFSDELIEIIRMHHSPLPEENSSPLSLPQIVQAADTIAHAAGLGHPASFNRLRKKAEEKLPSIFSLLKVPESEQKNMLSSFKRQFEMEYDLYAGTFGK